MIIVNFLRVYIVVGFIVAVLLNVFIIRLLQKALDILEQNKNLITQWKDHQCQPSSQQVEVTVHDSRSKPIGPTAQTHGGSAPGESYPPGDGG